MQRITITFDIEPNYEEIAQVLGIIGSTGATNVQLSSSPIEEEDPPLKVGVNNHVGGGVLHGSDRNRLVYKTGGVVDVERSLKALDTTRDNIMSRAWARPSAEHAIKRSLASKHRKVGGQ